MAVQENYDNLKQHSAGSRQHLLFCEVVKHHLTSDSNTAVLDNGGDGIAGEAKVNAFGGRLKKARATSV
jgi:hypothetical protein